MFNKFFNDCGCNEGCNGGHGTVCGCDFCTLIILILLVCNCGCKIDPCFLVIILLLLCGCGCGKKDNCGC